MECHNTFPFHNEFQVKILKMNKSRPSSLTVWTLKMMKAWSHTPVSFFLNKYIFSLCLSVSILLHLSFHGYCIMFKLYLFPKICIFFVISCICDIFCDLAPSCLVFTWHYLSCNHIFICVHLFFMLPFPHEKKNNYHFTHPNHYNISLTYVPTVSENVMCTPTYHPPQNSSKDWWAIPLSSTKR